MFLPLAFQQVHWLTRNSDLASSDFMLRGLTRITEHYMHIVCIHSISQYTQRSRVEIESGEEVNHSRRAV